MLTRNGITTGVYLRQRQRRFGFGSSKVGPVDYVGMVCRVGTDDHGRWFFQLRYLHQAGTNRKAALYWSEDLYEEDLGHFELIELEKVKEWLRGRAKKAPRLPAWVTATAPASGASAIQCYQLGLFDGDGEGDYVSKWGSEEAK